MSNSTDGVVNGQPFFQTQVAGGSGSQTSSTLSVLGPAASGILQQGVGGIRPDAPQGGALAKAMNERASRTFQAQQQQYQRQRMLQGMQAVALGKSVKEISEEQPWYSKIFGKSDVVLGAESYTKATAASQVQADLLEHMDSIKKLNPEQARQLVLKRFEAAQTGIPDVDVDVQSQLLQKFPQLMEIYTKESYKWQQEQATATQRQYYNTAADTLGTAVKALAMDPTSASGRNEAAALVAEFDLATGPIDGQEPAVYQKNFVDALMGSVNRIGEPIITQNPDGTTTTTYRSGHAMQAILGGSQNFRKLPQEIQGEILDRAEIAMRKSEAKFAMPYAEQIAKLDALIADPPMTARVGELVAAKNRIMEKVRQDSGSAFEHYAYEEIRADSVKAARAITAQRERDLQRRLADQQQRLSQTQGARIKELEREAREALLWQLQATDPIGYAKAKAAGAISSEEDKKASARLYESQSPEGKVNLLRARPDIIPIARAERSGTFDLVANKPREVWAKSGDEVLALLNNFQLDTQLLGPQKATDYWTPERAKALKEGVRLQQAGMPPDAVVAGVFNAYHGRRRATVSQKSLETAQDAITKQGGYGAFKVFFNPSLSRNPLTGTDLVGEMARGLSRDVAARMEELREVDPNSSDEHLMEMAQRDVLQDPEKATYEMVGGLPVQRLYPGQPSLNEWLVNPPNGRKGIPPDAIQDVMSSVVDEYLTGDVTNAYVTYSASGNAKFVGITVNTKNGGNQTIPVLLDDLLDRYHSNRAKRKGGIDTDHNFYLF